MKQKRNTPAPAPRAVAAPYRRILVFAAHPNDELGMGGTIARFRAAGAEISIAMLMTGSEGFPDTKWKNRIVAMRRAEAKACDRVLGVARRYHLGIPDMIGDGYTPERLKECIRIIREVRPEAAFTHGPDDQHNDHRVTHRLSVDALWHAGEPVSADLGPPWETAFRYYYKGVQRAALPRVVLDVRETVVKRFAAAAMQTSQFTLFKKDREALLEEGRRLAAADRPVFETFWLAEGNQFNDFPAVPAVEENKT